MSAWGQEEEEHETTASSQLCSVVGRCVHARRVHRRGPCDTARLRRDDRALHGAGRRDRLRRRVHGPRRAVAARSTRTPPARATRTSTSCSFRRTRRCCRTRRHRRDVELPAASGVLARHGALRQPVGAGVHARPVHARQRHEHLRRQRSGRRRLHRQAPGHRVPRAAVLPARLGRRGRPASAATRRSGAPRWRSSASTRIRTPACSTTPTASAPSASSPPTSRSSR